MHHDLGENNSKAAVVQLQARTGNYS